MPTDNGRIDSHTIAMGDMRRVAFHVETIATVQTD